MIKPILFTASGDREETLSLVLRFIGRQTIKEGDWIIVDDSQEPYSIPSKINEWNIYHLYRSPCFVQDYGLASQAKNYLLGMDYISKLYKDPTILFIGDDDYYAPTYVEDMLSRIEGVDAAGSIHAYYVNPLIGARRLNNKDHSAMESAAIRGAAIPVFIEAAHEIKKEPHKQPWIDKRFWDKIIQRKVKCRLFKYDQYLMFNLKGHKIGRPGIGESHRKGGMYRERDMSNLLPDEDLELIRRVWGLPYG